MPSLLGTVPNHEWKGLNMTLAKWVVAPLILAAVALSLSACSGVKPSLTAERPRDEAFRPVLKKELSCLNVPIEASTDDLAKALNQTIRKELYKGSTKTRGLSADILRNGPIAVSA